MKASIDPNLQRKYRLRRVSLLFLVVMAIPISVAIHYAFRCYGRICSVSVLLSERVTVEYLPEDRQNMIQKFTNRHFGSKYALPVSGVFMDEFPRNLESFHTALSRLDSIESIQLSYPLTDDSDGLLRDLFCECRSVSYLSFNSVNFTDADVSALAMFPNVESLSIRVKAKKKLSQLTNKGFSSLPLLESLKVLRIYNATNLQQGLKGLKNTPSLQQLEIVGTSTTTEASQWQALASLNDLKELILWGDLINNDGMVSIAECKSLKRLSIQHAPVDDMCLEYIGKLENLRFLDLSETRILGHDLDRLENVKNLVELYLGSDLQPGTSSLLQPSNSLRKLVLGGAGLTKNEIIALKKYPSLEELELVGTATSSRNALFLGNRKLRRLSLNAEHVSPIDLRELQQRVGGLLFSFHLYDNWPNR